MTGKNLDRKKMLTTTSAQNPSNLHCNGYPIVRVLLSSHIYDNYFLYNSKNKLN